MNLQVDTKKEVTTQIEGGTLLITDPAVVSLYLGANRL